jgi:hypothetical protein
MAVLLTTVFSLLAKFLFNREPITEQFPPDTQSAHLVLAAVLITPL